MSDIKKEEVEKLAELARIELRGGEAEELTKEISTILDYVGELNEITAESSGEKKVGPLHNVLREDEDPHESGVFTEDILESAPKRKGDYIEVKKILGE